MNESSHLGAALKALEVKLARAHAKVEALTKTRDNLVALLSEMGHVPESPKSKPVRIKIQWQTEVFGDSWKLTHRKRKFLVSVLPTRSAWTPTYRRWEVKHERKSYGTIEASVDFGVIGKTEWHYATDLPATFKGDINDFLRAVAQAVKDQVEGRV